MLHCTAHGKTHAGEKSYGMPSYNATASSKWTLTKMGGIGIGWAEMGEFPVDGSPAEWVWADCSFPSPTRGGKRQQERNGLISTTWDENDDEVLYTL